MPILFLVVFVVMAGFAMLLPSIMYVLENMGVSQAAATPILASYSFAQFVVGPFWGKLSDRHGRKPVLLVSLAGSAVSYAFLSTYADTAAHILIGLVAVGVFAGNTSVVLASVTDLTNAENRAKGMGLIGAGIGLSFTLGPFVGAMVGGANAQSATIASAALISSILCAVGLLVVLVRFSETHGAKARGHDGLEHISRMEAFGRIKSRPVLMQICLMMLCFTIPLAMMESTLSYFMEIKFHWGPQEMGRLFFVIGMVLMIVQGGLIGRLTSRFGERSLARSGIVLMGGGLITILVAPSTAMVYLGIVATSVGTAFFNTSMSSLASHRAKDSERGAVMGVFQSMQSLGRSSGPLVAGLLNQQLNGLPLLVGGGVMAIVLLWMVGLHRQLRDADMRVL
ncbi:MAG: MFS transporter [Alphaproteobacteria bacterium]|nr:MFS transporter [Alphaproteobacteria bacterium]